MQGCGVWSVEREVWGIVTLNPYNWNVFLCFCMQNCVQIKSRTCRTCAGRYRYTHVLPPKFPNTVVQYRNESVRASAYDSKCGLMMGFHVSEGFSCFVRSISSKKGKCMSYVPVPYSCALATNRIRQPESFSSHFVTTCT